MHKIFHANEGRDARAYRELAMIEIGGIATYNMPRERMNATVTLACFVICTDQSIGIGRRAYRKSEIIVMIDRAYDEALKDAPVAHL